MDKECYPQCSSRGFSLAELAVVVLIVAVISAFFLWRFVSPDKNPAGTRVPLTIITAEGVAWKPPKPAGDYALIAVLRGDPAVPGSPFVIRAKSIRNCEFPPMATTQMNKSPCCRERPPSAWNTRGTDTNQAGCRRGHTA